MPVVHINAHKQIHTHIKNKSFKKCVLLWLHSIPHMTRLRRSYSHQDRSPFAWAGCLLVMVLYSHTHTPAPFGKMGAAHFDFSSWMGHCSMELCGRGGQHTASCQLWSKHALFITRCRFWRNGHGFQFSLQMGTLVTMATGMPKRCPVKSFERPQTFIRGGHGHANEHLTSTELVGTLQNQAASE